MACNITAWVNFVWWKKLPIFQQMSNIRALTHRVNGRTLANVGAAAFPAPVALVGPWQRNFSQLSVQDWRWSLSVREITLITLLSWANRKKRTPLKPVAQYSWFHPFRTHVFLFAFLLYIYSPLVFLFEWQIQTATWWYGEGIFLTSNIRASCCRLQSLRSSANLYDRVS